jgi:hypothetical protein
MAGARPVWLTPWLDQRWGQALFACCCRGGRTSPTGTVESESTFFVGGTLNLSNPQFPSISGCTQIGPTLSGTGIFRNIYTFTGTAAFAGRSRRFFPGPSGVLAGAAAATRGGAGEMASGRAILA